MTEEAARERTLVRYLLGELPPQEQERIEERLFVEDGLHEDLLATTDDLVRAYLAGVLSGEEQARFENHFLASAQHRERLTFMKDLLQAVERVAPRAAERVEPLTPAPTAWRSWAVAAALLVLCGLSLAGWLLRGKRQEPRAVQASPAASAVPTRAPEEPRRDTDSSPLRPPPEQVVRFTKAAHPEPVVVRVSSRTRRLRLEVPIEAGGSPSYAVSLRTARDGEIWRSAGLEAEASGSRLTVNVPAGLFKEGEYTLRLEGERLRDDTLGTSQILEYPLRVARQP